MESGAHPGGGGRYHAGMTRVLPLFLLALLPLLPAQETASAARPVQGRLVVEEGQRTLYLWGGPKARGYAHGHLLARDILDAIEKDFGRFLVRLGNNTRIYERVLLRRVIPNFQFTNDEIEELQGMLEGIEAALPDEEDRTVELLGRPLTLPDLKAINTVGDWMALGCSSVALAGDLCSDGAPAVVRNFDFQGLNALLQKQHVVVVQPAGEGRRGYAGVSHPGAIGVMTGMNVDGVFVSVHDVRVAPSFADAFKPNVPRLCVLRRFLMDLPAAAAVPTALERAREWPTLYGNNIMVVTPDSGSEHPFAGVLEYDKREDLEGGAGLRLEDAFTVGDEDFLVCTNHHRRRGIPEGTTPRCWRFDALSETAVGGTEEDFEFPDLVRLVESAALPEEKPQRAYRHGTLHQAIGRCGPKRLHVRFGEVGKNIRECAWRAVEVPAAVGAAREGAASAEVGR